MSKEKSIREEIELDENNVALEKNDNGKIEKSDMKSGLVTTLLRHREAGFAMIGLPKKQKIQ